MVNAPAKGLPPGIAIDPRDTFIVSYPKSGNTWVRFLFANVLKPEGAEVDFHSAERFVPEPEKKPELVAGLQAPRFFKSHATYQPAFPRVIYIVRDPRDALVSYFEYVRKRLGPEATLTDLLNRQQKLAYGTWSAHVRSWYGRPGVRFFRYEDLMRETVATFTAMLKFARIERTADEVTRAIEASSFARMKAAEEISGRPFVSEQDRELATPFMREGRIGQWRDRLTEAQIELILRLNLREMLLLGYLPDPLTEGSQRATNGNSS